MKNIIVILDTNYILGMLIVNDFFKAKLISLFKTQHNIIF